MSVGGRLFFEVDRSAVDGVFVVGQLRVQGDRRRGLTSGRPRLG